LHCFKKEKQYDKQEKAQRQSTQSGRSWFPKTVCKRSAASIPTANVKRTSRSQFGSGLEQWPCGNSAIKEASEIVSDRRCEKCDSPMLLAEATQKICKSCKAKKPEKPLPSLAEIEHEAAVKLAKSPDPIRALRGVRMLKKLEQPSHPVVAVAPITVAAEKSQVEPEASTDMIPNLEAAKVRREELRAIIETELASLAEEKGISFEEAEKVEPDISQTALAALDDLHKEARQLAHRDWKDLYGPVESPAASLNPPSEIHYRQMTKAEIEHEKLKPEINGPDWDDLSSEEQRARLNELKKWQAHKAVLGQKAQAQENQQARQSSESVKRTVCPWLKPRTNRTEVDTVLDQLRGDQGIKDFIAYQAGNSLLFVRDKNDVASVNRLRRARTPSGWRWQEFGYGGWQNVHTSSTVRVIKVEDYPGDGFKLTAEGKWYAPNVEARAWTKAYRTKSKSLLYADGTPAHLKQDKATAAYTDQYNRPIELVDIGDPLSLPSYVTDEGSWVSEMHWLAKEYWIEQLKAQIADAEKTPHEVAVYADDISSWKSELEILTTHHFTLPATITVQPAKQFKEVKLPPVPDERPQERQAPQRAAVKTASVLDSKEWNEIYRGFQDVTSLDMSTAGDPMYHTWAEATIGYMARTDPKEFRNSTVISSNPNDYPATRRRKK
jgi:hypothetical protein